MLPRPEWIDYCLYCGGQHDEAACPQKREEEERAWRERERGESAERPGWLSADPKQGRQR